MTSPVQRVYRKFKRYFANDHCCWCTSFRLLATLCDVVGIGDQRGY